ncbi:MAG: hypothetical protein JWM91_3713 [Rhodospirillales bacterium]|nr:hypothetical protein [Rhodospirillales bacterium]
MLTRRDVLTSSTAFGFSAALPAFGDPASDLARKATELGSFVTSQMTQLSRDKLTAASEELLSEYPDDATFLGLDTGTRTALRSRLPDRSMEADATRAASCAKRLGDLKSINPAQLTGIDQVNLEVVTYAHALADEGYRRFHYGDNAVLNVWQAESNTPYAVSQASGFFATVPDFLNSQHPIQGKADADAYLARVDVFAGGLDAENARLTRDAALGSIAPDFLLDLTLKQMTDFQARSIADWGLVTSLATRANAKGIAGDWEGQAKYVCEKKVAPALARQIAILKDLRAKAKPDAGVWKLPDGEAYYDWLLKVGTTTPMSPDEVHKLGLEQVQSISAQMDVLLQKQGLTNGTVGQRMDALSKDPRYLFPNTDAGRADLIAYLNANVAKMRERLPKAFATMQKADLFIKRVPPEIEAGAPDGYEQDGTIDGSRPASYYINLRDTGNWPKFSLPTLTFHEGIPGHVWQGSFVHALPTIRSQLMFNAYVEGWALYSEQLGDELEIYADDPVGKLGYLQSIQFRACRLAVDTGLHAKRWTRDRAIQWMVEQNGNPVDSARGEIDRYCAWPGQACGYQIGHLHIDALRTKAKAALGARFDLRTFNDALLTSGSLPLTVLDGVIERFIKEV